MYKQNENGILVPTTLDGLTNVMTGIGTARSKRSHNQWALDPLNDWGQLEAAYQSNWIARLICDIPAGDCVREWRTIKSNNAEDIVREERDLELSARVEDAKRWADLYGGAGILMLTDQDLSRPLRIDSIKRGGLKRVLTFDRWDLTSTEINTWDVLAENYLQPEYYILRGGAQRIHWSHVIRFYGEKLPLRWMAVTQGWGDSVLRKCIEEVTDMVAAKGGISELMQEANIDVITRQGLTDELGTDQDSAIIDRYALFGMMKSNIQMALLDGEETLDRQTLNLSGVAPILEQFLTWISGCARIPITKLFGTSAKGMNATGEGDMRNYYDRIRCDQQKIGSCLRRLDEVLVRSATGKWDCGFFYEWNSLEQINDEQVARARLINAQRDAIYVQESIARPSQVMRNLQSDEVYQYDDDELEALEETESDYFEQEDLTEVIERTNLGSTDV